MEALVNDHLISALGWTLIHGIWQGSLVALLLAFLLKSTRKQTAHLRYQLAWIALLTHTLLQLATFTAYYRTDPITLSLPLLLTPGLSDAGGSHSFWFFTTSLKQHLDLIVLAWLAGVVFHAIRLMAGLAFCAGLRRDAAVATPEWQHHLTTLACRSGISSSVTLMESLRVKVPMTLGFLKPIILMPLGSLTGLPLLEVQAILCHELAHIKRCDYLVNLCQSLLEILFFYHPALWWISAQIRAERENCCDDLVVLHNHNPLTLAKALARLQEVQMSIPKQAMAAGSSSLVQRIRRLTTNPRLVAPRSEQGLLLMALMLSLLFSSLTLQAFAPQNQTAFENLFDQEESGSISFTDEDEQHFLFEVKNGQILALFHNGQVVPREDWPQFAEVAGTFSKDRARLKGHEKQLKEHERELQKMEAALRKRLETQAEQHHALEAQQKQRLQELHAERQVRENELRAAAQVLQKKLKAELEEIRKQENTMRHQEKSLREQEIQLQEAVYKQERSLQEASEKLLQQQLQLRKQEEQLRQHQANLPELKQRPVQKQELKDRENQR